MTEIVDRFLPSPGDAMRSQGFDTCTNDSNSNQISRSTRGLPSWGIWAICPACGSELITSDDKQDFNVDCNRCDYSGYRAINGFGHGHILGEDIQELNRAEKVGLQKPK